MPQHQHAHAHNPHHETGISDEAAIEAHDLMDRAEEEELKLHPQTSNESTDSTTSQARMGDMGKTMPTGMSSDNMKKNMKN